MWVFAILVLWTFTWAHPWRQISWGTKQDSIVESDLGAVIQDSNSLVDVEVPAEPADANDIYEEALDNLKNRKPPAPKKQSASVTNAEKEQAAKDYYANVRTNVSQLPPIVLHSLNSFIQVLLAWVLSNVSFIPSMFIGHVMNEAFVC